MPQPRAIDEKTGQAVLRLARKGLSCERIRAELGLTASAKSIERHLARMGFVRGSVPAPKAAKTTGKRPTTLSGRVNRRARTAVTASTFDALLASVSEATDEAILSEAIGVLRASMREQIPASDRARVATALSSLVARRVALKAAAREEAKHKSVDLAWMDSRLKNFERIEKEETAAKQAALERALAGASPELAAAVRRAVNGPALYAVEDAEPEQEEPHAAEG